MSVWERVPTLSTTEALCLLSAITSASAPAGGHVLDLPRVGEADRG